MPDVSILVCVHGKLELTRRCLDAIARPRPPGRFEVVVVDNASPTAAATRSRRWRPAIRRR